MACLDVFSRPSSGPSRDESHFFVSILRGDPRHRGLDFNLGTPPAGAVSNRVDVRRPNSL